MANFYSFGKKNVEFINELNYVFDNASYRGEPPKNLENLIMSMYMQIFSYNFDDRIDNELKFENISDISKKVWRFNYTNEKDPDIGVIHMQEELIPEFNKKTLDQRTQYMLEQIRNSVVHGDININDDGTVTIFNHDATGNETFRMKFEFECITDICEIISQSKNIDENVGKELFEALSAIKGIDKNMKEHNSDKTGFSTISKKYHDYKYPILLFHLLPLNEDDIHNNREYMNSLLELLPQREQYKRGELDSSRTEFNATDFSRIRNSIAHNQYFLQDGYLILFDTWDKKHRELALNCSGIEEKIQNITNRCPMDERDIDD